MVARTLKRDNAAILSPTYPLLASDKGIFSSADEMIA